MCRTEKIKLLKEFNRSLEGGAPGISSVLVKNMIGVMSHFNIKFATHK